MSLAESRDVSDPNRHSSRLRGTSASEPRLTAPGFAEQLEKEVGSKEGSEKDKQKDRTWG